MELIDDAVFDDNSDADLPPSLISPREDRDLQGGKTRDGISDERTTSTFDEPNAPEESASRIQTPSQESRSSALPRFLDRKTKRRQEQDSMRVRSYFDPLAVSQFLRGRYRAVWRERRRTLTGTGVMRYVHQYVPPDDVPEEDPPIDFESMIRNAVEDFERGDTGGATEFPNFRDLS